MLSSGGSLSDSQDTFLEMGSATAAVKHDHQEQRIKHWKSNRTTKVGDQIKKSASKISGSNTMNGDIIELKNLSNSLKLMEVSNLGSKKNNQM